MEPQLPLPDETNELPKRTTPTWEMELLLSGATVFALWQIAAAMVPFASDLLPRLDPMVAQIVSVLYIYLASGVILVGLAFIVHLIMRAHWVALVGMHSIYPHGLRMDKLKGGPVMRENLLTRWQDMDAAIERADNRATIVFGLGIGVARVLIPITLAVALIYGVAAAGCWLAGKPDDVTWVFPALSMALLLPFLGVQMFDRWFGDRLARNGRTYRFLARAMAAYSKIGLGREASPLITLYQSNVGDRRGNLVVVAVLLVSTSIAAVSLVVQRADLGVGNYGNFPERWRGMPGTLDGRHYASMQRPGDSPMLPYLPDPVVRGDYLRLVVPYVPIQQSRGLAACVEKIAPVQEVDGKEVAEQARHRAELLACYGAMHSLAIDGQPLALEPDWYQEARRDVRGLVYMIPVHDLAPGRHELALTSPDPREPGSKREKPLPDLMPFWR